jgi:hypothetical protein
MSGAAGAGGRGQHMKGGSGLRNGDSSWTQFRKMLSSLMLAYVVNYITIWQGLYLFTFFVLGPGRIRFHSK